jgi:enediyne biosynthesis protein E4
VNSTRSDNHWIGLKTVGTRSNRDGIGAKITITVGKRKMTDEVRSGSSYISQNDRRLHFGLGSATKIDAVEVRWPNGLLERFDNLSIDAIHSLKEGSGTAVSSSAEKSRAGTH